MLPSGDHATETNVSKVPVKYKRGTLRKESSTALIAIVFDGLVRLP